MGLFTAVGNFLQNFRLKKDRQSDIFYEPQGWISGLLGGLDKKYSHLSDWLPYSVYDEEKKIYVNNDGTKGVIYEISPRLIAGDSTPIELMLDSLPEGVNLQIMLYGSPNITNTVDTFLNNASAMKENAMYKTIAEEYAKFWEDKTKEPVNNIMSTRVKNHRVFFMLTFDNKFGDIEVEVISSKVKNILISKKFFPKSLSPDEFLPLLFEIFNLNHDFRNIPKYDDSMFINRQVLAPDAQIEIEDDCVISDKQYWGSLNVVSLPEYTHIYEFSKKLGDWLTNSLDKCKFNKLLRPLSLNYPYFILFLKK